MIKWDHVWDDCDRKARVDVDTSCQQNKKCSSMLSSYEDQKMHGYKMKVLRGWKKTKSDLFGIILKKYQRCVIRLKRCVFPPSRSNNSKRLSRTKLHPLPDRPIRRVASKLSRKPTNELERMRRKGDNWNANDLFRFQYGVLDGLDTEELREICEEWLSRLYSIPKKYCYLAWYASALYACFYRLAGLMAGPEEKKDLWVDVKREYAEIFQMGRRIWRRPTHPSRLRVVYDLAMLCVRFNDIQNDPTVAIFRDLLADRDNFDFSVLSEVQYAASIDKTVRLENHVIDQFFERRKSMLSNRSSIRSKTSSDTFGGSFRIRRSRNDSERSVTSRSSFRLKPDSMLSKEQSESFSPRGSFRSRKGSVSPRVNDEDTLSPRAALSPRGVLTKQTSLPEGNQKASLISVRCRKEAKESAPKENETAKKNPQKEKETAEQEASANKLSFKKKNETKDNGAKVCDDPRVSPTSPTLLITLPEETESKEASSECGRTSPLPTSPRSVRFAGQQSSEDSCSVKVDPSKASETSDTQDSHSNVCDAISDAEALLPEALHRKLSLDVPSVRTRSPSAISEQIAHTANPSRQDKV